MCDCRSRVGAAYIRLHGKSARGLYLAVYNGAVGLVGGEHQHFGNLYVGRS